MTKKQLFSLTSETYRLPFAVDSQHQIITMDASHIPMLQWPDKCWCFEINLYMLDLYKRGLSRRNNGGTLRTYAANLSHLIRYCYCNEVDFIDLTDNHFSLFIKTLQGERNIQNFNQLIRDANTIIHIGRNCLDFLRFVGEFHNRTNFVGDKGTICSIQKEFDLQLTGKSNHRRISKKYWDHHSFPTPDPYKKRLPIASADIKKLRQAIREIEGISWFLKRRKQIMLMLLEVTGGRRSEVAALTVDSVMTARAMKEPLLKLITVKRRRDTYRYVPIVRPDLDKLISYIEKDRQRIIRQKVGLNQDHGMVFVSETTGLPIKAPTLSDEINALARVAQIDGKICAHMFRHRFITKLFVSLIEQHQFDQADDFRKALLDTQSIKQKIQQWTGHANLTSLDVYIDLAFDEVSKFNNTLDRFFLKRVVDSLREEIEDIQHELQLNKNVNSLISKIEMVLNNFEMELENVSLSSSVDNP